MKLPEKLFASASAIIAGVLALVVALGVVIVVVATSGSDKGSKPTATGADARTQITAVIQESIHAMQGKDDAAFNQTQCAAKRPTDTGRAAVDDLLSKINLKSIDPITVNSDTTAQAVIRFDYSNQPGQVSLDTLDLVKEDGKWLIC